MDNQGWLWDMYPLAKDAWGNVLFAKDQWQGWLNEGETTIVLRRWVTGPNGPSFLSEYTPADDYIADGHSGSHLTFNSLYKDEDRLFYVPQPQDVVKLKELFPALSDPANPSWRQVEAELVAAGRSLDELQKMTPPTLIRLLADAHSSPAPASPAPAPASPEPAPAGEPAAPAPTPEPAPAGKPDVEDTEPIDDGAGGPEQDPYDTRCASWIGKRIYLGDDTEVSRLFWLLTRPVGARRKLHEVQRAIDHMETNPDDSPPEDVRKAGQRVRKVVSKLRAALRDAGLNDNAIILREGGQEDPSYTMVWRFSAVPAKRSRNSPS
jgi:hypothetical protein